jgi:hypothetical protein
MGHQVGTQIERAYRRTDVLDKHRQLMRHGRSGASGMRLDATTRNPFGNRTAAAVGYEEARFLLISGSKVRALVRPPSI